MAAILEPSSESEAALAAVPLRLRLAWKCGRRVLLWIKALGSLVLLVLSGLADQYNVTDIVGFVREMFANSARLTIFVAVAAAGFIFLKTVLKLPKGFSAKSNLDDGD